MFYFTTVKSYQHVQVAFVWSLCGRKSDYMEDHMTFLLADVLTRDDRVTTAPYVAMDTYVPFSCFIVHALAFKTYMLFETCSSFRENRQLVNSDNITPKNKYHRIKILVMFLLKQFYISREYKESQFGDRLQNLM